MNKNSLFDDVARSLASPIPRRRACAQILRGLGVAALASLGIPQTALAGKPKCDRKKGESQCGDKCCKKHEDCCGGKQCCKQNEDCCGRKLCCKQNEDCCGGKQCCRPDEECKGGKCKKKETKKKKNGDGL
jgi:hypothetical protein